MNYQSVHHPSSGNKAMGNFYGFVSTPEALIPVCKKHNGVHVYPIGQGFALIPLVEDLWEESAFVISRPTGKQSGPFPSLEVHYGPVMAEFIKEASATVPVAYIGGSYSAGSGGWQVAIVWNLGRIILGPLELGWEFEKPAPKGNRMAPINLALRYIGVVAQPGLDEFASVDIDREPEDWFYMSIKPLDEIE